MIVYYRPLDPFNRITNSLDGLRRYWLVAFIGIFLLASFVFLVILDRKVRKPLDLLTEAIKEVSFGNTDKLVQYSGPKEFENVCHSFNDMQERLSHETHKREETEAQKTRILSDISHDLRTPVTGINGFAKALMDDKIKDADKGRVYERIAQKSEYLGKLISSFGDYSKLDRKDFNLELEKVNLSDFSRDFFIEQYDEIELRGYKLDIDIEDQIHVDLDKVLFRRVFENILSNIFKYTPKGTEIVFELKRDGSKAYIRFGDYGPGIEPHLEGEVFEPFIVGERARSAKVGSGLGLAIVKQIVEKHEAYIELVSPDEGLAGTLYRIDLNCH